MNKSFKQGVSPDQLKIYSIYQYGPQNRTKQLQAYLTYPEILKNNGNDRFRQVSHSTTQLIGQQHEF